MAKLINHKPLIVDSANLNAMVRALRKVPKFTVKRDSTSVVVTHPKAGEVFRALKGTRGDWMVREVANLWSPKI